MQGSAGKGLFLLSLAFQEKRDMQKTDKPVISRRSTFYLRVLALADFYHGYIREKYI